MQSNYWYEKYATSMLKVNKSILISPSAAPIYRSYEASREAAKVTGLNPCRAQAISQSQPKEAHGFEVATQGIRVLITM